MNENPVVALHRSTMHGDPPPLALRNSMVAFRPLDPSNRPAPLKLYPGARAAPLPRSILASSLPALDVLSGQRGEPEPLDQAMLGTLLFLSAGVTRVIHTADGPVWFRAAMSAGNLHPVEVYVVSDAGVCHYQPLEHALVPLRQGPGEGTGVSGRTSLVLTGIPFRTCWKYGERGWRHLWWDAGTMLANLVAVADAHGVAVEVLTAFPDAEVARLVGVDGVDEAPLVVVRLGAGELFLPDTDSLGPVMVEPEPVARRVLRFPMVVEAHAVSSLDDWGSVGAWRQAAAAWRQGAAGAVRGAPTIVAPPPNADPGDRVEDVVGRRGSARVFRRQAAPARLLDWGLAAAAARAVPFDAAPEGTLLEHLVNVHDVDGTQPGGYRYTAGGGYQALTSTDDNPRRVGSGLCLGQDLGGDSAYTVFHATGLDPLIHALGGRGYRAAQLEAGMVAGRLALNSTALGAGATGLTFYDSLVSRYFGADSSPMLATAVGIPATAPAPAGRPGEPAQLRRLV